MSDLGQRFARVRQQFNDTNLQYTTDNIIRAQTFNSTGNGAVPKYNGLGLTPNEGSIPFQKIPLVSHMDLVRVDNAEIVDFAYGQPIISINPTSHFKFHVNRYPSSGAGCIVVSYLYYTAGTVSVTVFCSVGSNQTGINSSFHTLGGDHTILVVNLSLFKNISNNGEYGDADVDIYFNQVPGLPSVCRIRMPIMLGAKVLNSISFGHVVGGSI